jgi:rhodanese-related sulfurtransferase
VTGPELPKHIPGSLHLATSREVLLSLNKEDEIVVYCSDENCLASKALGRFLAAAGIPLKEGTASEKQLAKLRETYEPFVSGLAKRIQVSLPPWLPPEDALDDWQTSAWDEQFPSIHHTLKQVLHPSVNEIHSEASTNDFPRRLDR